MTKLESVNQILAGIGEPPMNELVTSDYTLSIIDSLFDVNKRRILNHGFNFNTDKMALAVNVDNQIVVPTTIIKLRFPAGSDNLTIRFGKVWDRNTETYWAQPVAVLATLDIDFEQIPEPFQHWITGEIAAAMRLRVAGLDQMTVYLQQQAFRAKAVALNSEPQNTYSASGWGAVQAVYGA